MGQRRRRRSISPKFLISEEVKYFDEINTNSKDVDNDDDLDNFSFVDDDDENSSISSSSSNNNSDGDYDKSASESESNSQPLRNINRIKRNAAGTNDGDSTPSHRELHFETLQFDGDSDEDINGDSGASNSNKGRRKNKGGNRNNGNAANGSPKGRKNDDNDDNKEPPLDKLVKDIRQKVKDTKKFWTNLPYQICNIDEFAAPSSSDANCWNGNTVDRHVI